MRTRLLIPLMSCVISLGAFAAQPLSHAMPKGAMGYVEFHGLGNKLFQLRDSDSLKTFLATPQYKQLVTNPEFNKVLAGKALVEGVLGMGLGPDGHAAVRAADHGGEDRAREHRRPAVGRGDARRESQRECPVPRGV